MHVLVLSLHIACSRNLLKLPHTIRPADEGMLRLPTCRLFQRQLSGIRDVVARDHVRMSIVGVRLSDNCLCSKA